MSKETVARKAERAEALGKLREWIKPGDTVYTVLDHVSSSGMSRAIRVVLLDVEDGRAVDRHPNYAVGRALGLRHWKRNGREQDALVVGGAGMDMGFHLVYELSSVLYGGRLVPDIYKAGHDKKNGITRDGAPAGYVFHGGYKCLGRGKCPSNYHTNHRDQVRCDGISEGETRRACYAPTPFGRWKVPEDWPRGPEKVIEVEGDDGQPLTYTVSGPLLSCLHTEHDGAPYEVCPTCSGAGYLPNPEGPERFDLIHTDGYALRHRWL